jgi:hypothetical protein
VDHSTVKAMTSHIPIRSAARRALVAIGCALTLAACEKNAVQDITGALPASRIRFFNFGLNAPSVNFYANDTKVSATASATGVESVTGVSFGGVSFGGLYAGIAPGGYTISGRIAATVDKDVPVSRLPVILADGKRYSVYLAGLYDATAKQQDSFIVEDPFSDSTDFSQALVRFVNASHNANPLALVVRNTTTTTQTPIGAAVAYKAAGAFVGVPAGVYDLSALEVGSTTGTITRTAVSFAAGRIYTITARGDITIGGTTNVNRAQLDNTPNR